MRMIAVAAEPLFDYPLLLLDSPKEAVMELALKLIQDAYPNPISHFTIRSEILHKTGFEIDSMTLFMKELASRDSLVRSLRGGMYRYSDECEEDFHA